MLFDLRLKKRPSKPEGSTRAVPQAFRCMGTQSLVDDAQFVKVGKNRTEGLAAGGRSNMRFHPPVRLRHRRFTVNAEVSPFVFRGAARHPDIESVAASEVEPASELGSRPWYQRNARLITSRLLLVGRPDVAE